LTSLLLFYQAFRKVKTPSIFTEGNSSCFIFLMFHFEVCFIDEKKLVPHLI
jgi:hypothetical protein